MATFFPLNVNVNKAFLAALQGTGDLVKRSLLSISLSFPFIKLQKLIELTSRESKEIGVKEEFFGGNI